MGGEFFFLVLINLPRKELAIYEVVHDRILRHHRED